MNTSFKSSEVTLKDFMTKVSIEMDGENYAFARTITDVTKKRICEKIEGQEVYYTKTALETKDLRTGKVLWTMSTYYDEDWQLMIINRTICKSRRLRAFNIIDNGLCNLDSIVTFLKTGNELYY